MLYVPEIVVFCRAFSGNGLLLHVSALTAHAVASGSLLNLGMAYTAPGADAVIETLSCLQDPLGRTSATAAAQLHGRSRTTGSKFLAMSVVWYLWWLPDHSKTVKATLGHLYCWM